MWTSKIFTSVYSRLSANGRIRLVSKYPKIVFTNATPKAKITQFPTVIISEMAGNDFSKTFEGKTVNATYSNIEIQVITDVNQEDADYVADVCYDLITDLSYSATMKPMPSSNSDDVFRNVARYTRAVGNEDII